MKKIILLSITAVVLLSCHNSSLNGWRVKNIQYHSDGYTHYFLSPIDGGSANHMWIRSNEKYSIGDTLSLH